MIKTSMGGRCAMQIFAALFCCNSMASPAPFATMRLETTQSEEVFSARLAEGDDQGGRGIAMTVQFRKPESSDRRPQFSLCATLPIKALSECLQFVVGDGGDTLELYALSGSGNQKTASLVAFPHTIPIDQSFQVSMRIVDGHSLSFVVNGVEFESRALNFDATEYEYGCDAVNCDLTLAKLVTPKSRPPVETIGKSDLAFYQQGVDELNQQEYETAIRDLSKFIEKAKVMSRPYAARAQAWLALGKIREALSDLNDALRLDSEMGHPDDTLFFLGKTRVDVEALRDRLQERKTD